MNRSWLIHFAVVVSLFGSVSDLTARETLPLKANWSLQSSAEIEAKGETLSTPTFEPKGWYTTTVPATVLAALVENDVYPDPYYADNLKKIPGYRDGRWLVVYEDSPFYPSWWYRTEFTVPTAYRGKHVVLHFDGINYRANIWLNGKKIAGSDDVVGMFRRFEFDVDETIVAGKKNVLAVEVISPGHLPDKEYPTKQVEATTGWDDHNPYPPDMNMGIWEDVYLSASGPVILRHPYVSSQLDIPSLAKAQLTASVHATNTSKKSVQGTVSVRIEDIRLSKKVTLGPNETQIVTLDPKAYAELNLTNPRVWWPNPLGPQELYTMNVSFTTNGTVSDSDRVTFGIREATSFIDKDG